MGSLFLMGLAGVAFAAMCCNMFPSNSSSYKKLEAANKEIDNMRAENIRLGKKLDMDAYFCGKEVWIADDICNDE